MLLESSEKKEKKLDLLSDSQIILIFVSFCIQNDKSSYCSGPGMQGGVKQGDKGVWIQQHHRGMWLLTGLRVLRMLMSAMTHGGHS